MADGSQKQNIEINPSTELLPDEFDGEKPSSVHIFRVRQDEETCTSLDSSLKSCSSSGKIDIHQYKMDTFKSVEAQLDEIAKANYDNNSCMMLFMMGRSKKISELGVLFADEDDEPMQIDTIWSKFISNDSLRKKPKIFVFQATVPQTKDQGGTTTDSLKKGDCKLDFPLEADIFITFKNLSYADSGAFIKSLCKRIVKYAHRDDIIDIATQADNEYDYKVPPIISTLTRKFYFKPASFRGYRHDVIEQVNTIEKDLESAMATLEKCNFKTTTSGELISRTSSLQNITPRSPKRKTSETPAYRPRTNSKTNPKPWKY